MANAETQSTTSLPELTAGGVARDVPTPRDTAEQEHAPPATPSPPLSRVDSTVPLVEPSPIAPVRSSLVPLGSQAAAAAPPPPQPKRFSAVNINKKFLEKNSSSSSASSAASPSSAASKTGGPVSRTLTQPTPTHSRLVTTKLTTAPQALSAAGPGWSRPSSATPPASTTPTINGLAAPTPSASDPSSSSSGPQQPQSRPVPARRETPGGGGGGTSGKPVWGASKPQQQRPNMASQSDFPTAAEVAAAPRKSKPTFAERNLAAKEAATAREMAVAATNQARMEQADTFRGVHLDPNAHHWDEMEEDDDNFLDGVLDFGDGRQYKIESADLPTDASGATLVAAESLGSLSSPSRSASRLDESSVLVSKEERFADDFDRSWPRSRASPSVSTRDLPTNAVSSSVLSASGPSPVSPAIPSSIPHAGGALLHSSQDASSRPYLFNERSNKLEPYNRAAGVGGQKAAVDARGREFPATQQQGNNTTGVQLLQNRGKGSIGGPAVGGERQQQARRDGAAPAQQQNVGRNGGPPNPWMQRKESSDGSESRGRRLSAMGPPPVPAPAAQLGVGGRQRPPHLAMADGGSESDVARPLRRPSTSRSRPSSSARRDPSQSPALSHVSAVAQSPASAVAPLSGVELDEAQKDVMQTAAARAKARRQQEEEEREKERERAKRKAAELEERIRAAEAEKAKASDAQKASHAQEVLDAIESTAKSATAATQPVADVPKPAAAAPTDKPLLRRPSVVGSTTESRPGPPRRTSSNVSAPALAPVQTETSWRSKASPISATATTVPTPIREIQRRPSIPSFIPPPSALDQVQIIAEDLNEELEVVDFSDLGKFVGVAEENEEPEASGPAPTESIAAAPVRPPRPVASDFFDSRPSRSPEVVATAIPAVQEKAGAAASWRRPGMPHVESHSEQSSTSNKERPVAPLLLESTKDTPSSSSSVAQPPSSPTISLAPPANRTPRSQQSFHKEAPMSTLDDVMSRIKGAIDGMQTSRAPEFISAPSVPKPSLLTPPPAAAILTVQKERWVPPAFRPRPIEQPEPREVVVTGCEPPRSPKPAWNMFVTRLPKISQSLEPVARKQLLMFIRPMQFRWDVLSFDPPVEGMSRREFAVNEILFRRTGGFKGKNKYKVLLPTVKSTGPKVNIPMTPRVNGVGGAFGRPSADSSLSTWRKPAVSANLDLGEAEAGLSTMSRSPPPDVPSDPSFASLPPRSDALTSSKSDDVFGSSRSKMQLPKMPAGSSVAFYRDSRVDLVEPDAKPSVSFIVSSELEDSRQSSETPSKSKPSIMVSSPASTSLETGNKPFAPMINGLKPSPTSSPEIGLPSLISATKTDSKSSDDSTPITPPSHHTSTWARSSLSLSGKGPDPEHLKAVWSQTSNKAGLHSVNSLEGIADDLTAIPFTLQEVKSEDGGTPPPTASASAPPSRMSLHDVTRAFQQVPSSSSSSSAIRPSISPPSTSAPVARPPPNYPNYHTMAPPPNQMMRPTYAPYSPMMGSPTPSMMYPMAPSPVPARMGVNGNAHPPLYGQPVWMAPPQNAPGVMRPMGSPYPQLMPYPTPTGTPMYAPQPQHMQNVPVPPQQQQQANAARGRGMPPPMTPGVPHQNVMYPASPILMHAPPMPVGYMNMPAGRGQMRNDNGHAPMQPQQQQPQHPPQHQNGHPMHAPGYNPVPSTSFVRPTW